MKKKKDQAISSQAPVSKEWRRFNDQDRPSKAHAMMMKSIGDTMFISIVNPKCPTPTSLLKGEEIVQSIVKAIVRTMAKEMMEFTKNNILTQASQAMLAQANQAPQGVLQLLR